MKLQDLLDECQDAINAAAYERESEDDNIVFATVNLNDGWVELEADKKPLKGQSPVIAMVKHDDETNERECPNLEEYIEKNISVDWDAADDYVREQCEISDVWNDHGFADEQDYINWRYK